MNDLPDVAFHTLALLETARSLMTYAVPGIFMLSGLLTVIVYRAARR